MGQENHRRAYWWAARTGWVDARGEKVAVQKRDRVGMSCLGIVL